MKSSTTILALTCVMGLLASSWVSAAQSHCQSGVGERRASTPSTIFDFNQDGTVVLRANGLQWSRCALGQSWNGNDCEGTALALTWEEAQRALDQLNSNGGLAGHSDWRLPSRGELESIIEKCRAAPAINERAFPNTPWAGFWTSSLDTSEEEHAWFVGFYHGLSYEYSRAASYRVRPVRPSSNSAN
jgi:hypothetical protein